VTVVDDHSLGRPENLALAGVTGVEVVAADIRDTDRMRGLLEEHQPDVLYHLAAIHFIPACEREPTRAVSVNTAGTQSLLDAWSAVRPPGPIVFASTAAVYAPSETPHDERAQLRPTDIYGLSKLWMEQAAELFHQRTGVPVGIARLFNVVGPGETNPHLVPAIIEQARDGNTLKLGNLTTRRDYIDVDDIARGLIALGEAAPSCDYLICNLGAERPASGEEIVELLAELLGRDLVVDIDPARLRASDRPVLASDCARAHDAIRWRAEIPLRQALARQLGGPIPALDSPAIEQKAA
jgi:UDP-glucose 4-epimerase